MGKDLQKNSDKDDIFGYLKKKAIDLGADYLKKNFSFSKEDIAGYVEKHVRRSVERRIRFEVRKQVFRYLVLLFFALGLAFIVYFVLDLAVLLLELPLVFTNLLFGLFLLLVSLVLYIMR